MANLLDARNLMIDRRKAIDSVYWRPLGTLIARAIEPDVMDPWRMHDWYWCIRDTRGYKSRVHPL